MLDWRHICQTLGKETRALCSMQYLEGFNKASQVIHGLVLIGLDASVLVSLNGQESLPKMSLAKPTQPGGRTFLAMKTLENKSVIACSTT